MLIGRGDEQRTLDRLVDGARRGTSGVLVLRGEAGVGKTALLDHVAGRSTGLGLLRARGVHSEAHVPFAGLFELLRPTLGLVDRLPPPQAEALGGALALRPGRSQDRFAIGAATLSLLAARAEEGPLLVLVDDAHWLDGSSADALLFALRRLVADPIAVVLALRAGEASVLSEAALPTLELAGLDRASTAELVGRHLGGAVPGGLVERLHHHTGGNPLALLELAAHADQLVSEPFDHPPPIVPSVAARYQQRIAALPGEARDVLLLAAAGDTTDLAVLDRAARLLGRDLAALADGEAAGLIRTTGTGVEFHHPLVRSAVYGSARPERRRAVHRALAGALPDVEADRRAWHLALAALGPDAAASSALEQAARRARSRSAYDVSSRAFERSARLAVEDDQRCRLLHEAAGAAWLAGHASRAGDLLDEAAPLARTAELALPVEHLRGHIASRRGPVRDGHRILLAAGTAAAPTDPERAAVLLAEAVNAAFYAGDAAAMARAAAPLAPLRTVVRSPRGRFYAAMAVGMAGVFSGRGEQGAPLIREAVALVERSADLAADPPVLAWAAMGPLWLREADLGAGLLDRALADARRQSVIGVLPHLLSHIGIGLAATDRWPDAAAAFAEAITLARETGQRTDLATALARLAWLDARQGREEPARRHAAEARELAAALGLAQCEVWSRSALAELELAGGHLDAAEHHLEAQDDALRRWGIGDVDLSPVPELVEVALRRRRPDDVVARLEVHERAATAKGQPWALARAARSRGLVAGDDGFECHFEHALALHHRTPDVFETARTELAYGRRLRRVRRRVDARRHLRAALDAFDRLGAEPWSELARTELAATGETARRRDASTLDQLTPQERQVALLLAAGHTTREAAAALFLSPKTVEFHLRSAYRKLGIASRAELAVVMTRP